MLLALSAFACLVAFASGADVSETAGAGEPGRMLIVSQNMGNVPCTSADDAAELLLAQRISAYFSRDGVYAAFHVEAPAIFEKLNGMPRLSAAAAAAWELTLKERNKIFRDVSVRVAPVKLKPTVLVIAAQESGKGEQYRDAVLAAAG